MPPLAPDSAAASPAAHDPGPPSARLLDWCDRHRGWILLAVLLLFAGAFNTHWRPHSDSAVHLEIARHIVEGHGFTHPTGQEVRMNPGLAYLMAAPMALVGTDHTQLWLANALMMGIGLAALAVAYRLFSVVIDRPTAVLLTAMLAISLTFFGHTLQLLTDIPFLLGGLLFLLGWARWGEREALATWPITLMVAGATIMALFRTVAITFLGAAALALVAYGWQQRHSPEGRRNGLTLLAIVAVVVVGLTLALVTSSGLSGADPQEPAGAAPRVVDEPTDDLTLIRQGLTQIDTRLRERVPANLNAMFTDNLTVAAFGVNFGTGPNLVLALALLIAALTLVRRQPLWALLILAFIVQMLLFLSERRYFLAILPMLLVGWWFAALWLERHLPARGSAYAVGIMVALWAVPNAARSVDQLLEQRDRPYLEHLSDGKYADYHRLAMELGEHVEPDGLVVHGGEIDVAVVSFWARRTLVEPGQFASVRDFEGPVYVLEPRDESVDALIEQRGWVLGESMFRIEPSTREAPYWSLHEAGEAPADARASP